MPTDNPNTAKFSGSHAAWQEPPSRQEKENGGRYVSFVSGAGIKEEGGQLFYEGFVSDPTWDTGNDIVEDQQALVDKINSDDALANKLSFRHDWLKAQNRNDYPPFGRLAQPAELRVNPISGKKAAWVSTVLNPNYPDFNAKVEQIRGGFVNGFSIEYDVKPGGATYETDKGVLKRHIVDYRLLGFGAAARPMHPNAISTGFYAKELEDDDDDMECNSIGKHNNMPDSAFDAEQLNAGTTHEMEHTDDPVKAKSIAKDHLSEDPDYYKKLREMEHKENHGNFGSAAARQETAKCQGGNSMDENKEAELLKQLEAERAQRKELEGKVKELSDQVSVVGELKEDYAKFKKENEAKVLANAKEVEEAKKHAEVKEAEVKEFKEAYDKYKEKPSWEGASDLLRRVGGPTEAG